MAKTLIGNALAGRQFKTDGSNSNEKPIEISAAHGNGTTAGSATEFLKLTGTSGAGESGEFNITTADVTNNTNAGGILVDVNGTQRYIPIYAITP
tara:strand:+ start:421 stop:705 length:285 start_codon:yes stop_codon:yes gene_type:complete